MSQSKSTESNYRGAVLLSLNHVNIINVASRYIFPLLTKHDMAIILYTISDKILYYLLTVFVTS